MCSEGENAKMQCLMAHYKDSFDHIRAYSNDRNRIFILLLLMVALMQFVSPGEAPEILSGILNKTLGASPTVTPLSVGILLWTATLFILTRYLQIAMTIDLQYSYLHSLEEQLSEAVKPFPFDRERRGYEKGFDGIRKVFFIFYRGVFPIVYTILLTSRLVAEMKVASVADIAIWIDCVLFLLCVLLMGFYSIRSFCKES